VAAEGFRFAFDRTRAFNLARCADIALRVHAHRHAATLYDRLLPLRRQFATAAGISSRGSVELSLGRLAAELERHDTMQEHFELADRAHERMRAPLLRARTWLAWGEALAAVDPPRAADLLGRARAHALEPRHRSAAIAREAQALLHAVAEVPVDAT
jgi:hypothetical protein